MLHASPGNALALTTFRAFAGMCTWSVAFLAPDASSKRLQPACCGHVALCCNMYTVLCCNRPHPTVSKPKTRAVLFNPTARTLCCGTQRPPSGPLQLWLWLWRSGRTVDSQLRVLCFFKAQQDEALGYSGHAPALGTFGLFNILQLGFDRQLHLNDT